MTRPLKAAEKARKKQKVYEAARQIFLKKGFRRATIGEITRQANLSPGAFYLYFQSKADIFARLTADSLSRLRSDIRRVAARQDLSPAGKLLTIRQLFFNMDENHRRLMLNLIAPRRNTDGYREKISPKVRQKIRELSDECIDILADILRDGMEKKMFRRENPVAVADTIWGMFSGMLLLEKIPLRRGGRASIAPPALETAFDTLYRGLHPAA